MTKPLGIFHNVRYFQCRKQMGHTGLELCAKTTGNTPLCEEGGAKSGAVVADEVLESVALYWNGIIYSHSRYKGSMFRILLPQLPNRRV